MNQTNFLKELLEQEFSGTLSEDNRHIFMNAAASVPSSGDMLITRPLYLFKPKKASSKYDTLLVPYTGEWQDIAPRFTELREALDISPRNDSIGFRVRKFDDLSMDFRLAHLRTATPMSIHMDGVLAYVQIINSDFAKNPESYIARKVALEAFAPQE